MSMKDKLLECKYFFDTIFRQHISYLNYQLGNDASHLFRMKFIDNIPFITIQNGEINIKWA